MSDVPPGLASLVLKEKTKKSFNVLSVVFLIFFCFFFHRGHWVEIITAGARQALPVS